MDNPTHLIVINGVNSEELFAQMSDEIRRWSQWYGRPILPPGLDVKVIDLRSSRIEPDIEDEP